MVQSILGPDRAQVCRERILDRRIYRRDQEQVLVNNYRIRIRAQGPLKRNQELEVHLVALADRMEAQVPRAMSPIMITMKSQVLLLHRLCYLRFSTIRICFRSFGTICMKLGVEDRRFL